MFYIAMFIEIGLIVAMAVASIVTYIVLLAKYARFNIEGNSIGYTAEETARKILDKNGLRDIDVKSVRSFVFGNSYSRYFRKVRIRRCTRYETSVTALAIGSEKAALAVLDKEGDPDMKARVRLTPLMYLGPVAFIPLLAIGIVIEIIFIISDSDLVGVAMFIALGLVLLLYLISVVLCIFGLKTEKKAQVRAIEILRAHNLATEEEVEDMRELYKLYNVQYVNDIILSMLELILRFLRFVFEVVLGAASRS